jgi:hypothetical protein
MSRISASKRNNIPALIPCDDEISDGFVQDRPVRIVTREELVELQQKATKEKRPPKEIPNYLYLAHLKLLSDAGERKDLTAARKAAKVIVPYLPIHSVRGTFDRQEFVQTLEEFTARDALNIGVNLGGWESGAVLGCGPVKFAKANQAERMRLSIRANANSTEAVRTAEHAKVPPLRFERPIDAMLCPDIARAYAYLLFFDGLAVCPRCSKLFAKESEQQSCCSVKCRESHRVTRWREAKKERERLRQEELANRKASRRGGKR